MFKSLLLWSASCVLLQSAIADCAPAQAIGAATVTAATSADADRACQQATNAVVTLYSGAEIGAGSIINTDGTILTAYHVVKEAVSKPGKVKIYVKLANGQRYIGQAIASDTRNDLALVQMPAPMPGEETLSTLPLANVSLQRGQAVCAIGSPSGRTGVLSRGAFKTVLANGDLQSAVRLTYGNSGGPLLNAQGALVGVNKAIWLSDRGENTGISYATSAQTVQTFIAKHGRLAGTVTQLTPVPSVAFSLTAPLARKSQGKSQETSQVSTTTLSTLGVSLDTKMLVQRVESDSPAALGGLQRGDRLLAINGTQLSELSQLQAFLSRQPSTVVLTISHQQKIANVQIYF